MTTFAAHAPPRASGPSDCGIPPPASLPPLLLPVLRILLLRQELRHLLPVHVEERRLVDVHELPDDDRLPEDDVPLPRGRPPPDDPVPPSGLPVLPAELHLVQAAP